MSGEAAVRLWAVVPAAGAGRRMGASIPKQYLPLAGRTVLECTVARLQEMSDLAGIVVALAPDDALGRDLLSAGTDLHLVAGGTERAWSVLAGLEYLAARAGAADWVLVHDAARPCVRRDDIRRLWQTSQQRGYGAILASPIADTVKRATPDQRVAETLDRSLLWRAQTPQLFPLLALRDALRAAHVAGVAVTDEAAAMEQLGHPVALVPGSGDNIKITHAEDLALAEFLLAQQCRESTCE
jgi:2-C-methyl-D-erythritol 4-phosphate cytidylyltransferase